MITDVENNTKGIFIMTGSIQEKNGRYHAVVNVKGPDGKIKKKWKSTGLKVKGNKKNAEEFLRNYIIELEKEQNEREKSSKPDGILFADYIEKWLETAKIRLDEITYQGYKNVADSQVIPYFRKHNTYLEKLSREDIQGYINEKHANGRVDGKGGLSAKSIKTHMIVIRQAIKEAMRDKLISSNPAEFVVMPKMQRRNVDFYTESELNILFEAIKNEPLYYFYYFSIIFGLRRSETLGLKWDSINFENGLITINHTVVKFSTIVQKDCTKSDASYRAFPMMQEIKDILVELKQQEETNRKLFGKDYIENDYIFKKVNGEPYRPDYVSKKFGNLLKKNGLRKIRLHDLRHSCASLLATNGYNMKDIQEWLGHKDIQTTANIYSHLDISRKIQIAGATVGFVPGKNAGKSLDAPLDD